MYKTITITQLCNGLANYNTKQISLNSLRVYFATYELTAIREAAERTRKRNNPKGKGKIPSYRLKELTRLTGLSEPEVSRSLRELDRASLVTFSDHEVVHRKEPLPEALELIEAVRGQRSAFRPIPFPRQMLRYIATCTQGSLIKVIVGYAIRGLTIERKGGGLRNAGSVKARWFEETFNLSLRSVKSARKTLISLGWISADTGSTQRKLNRTGSYFVINLEWKCPTIVRDKTTDTIQPTAQGALPQPVDNSECLHAVFAPLTPENAPQIAPPIENKKTLNRSKNQKSEKLTSGVFLGEGRELKPTIKNITLADLQTYDRMFALYQQGIEIGLIEESEANLLNWMAAAVRAKTCNGESPPRIFMGIVRKKLWHCITQADEDRARTAIVRARELEESCTFIEDLAA